MKTTADKDTLARWAKIESVQCPRCGAEAGARCHQNGRSKAQPHQARRSAAADAKAYVP